MWFLALFSFVFSVVLVGVSVFPGILEQVPSDLRAIGGGAYGLLAFGLASWRLLGPNRTGGPRRRGSALVVPLCVVVTPLLLLTHTPRGTSIHRREAGRVLSSP